MNAYRARYAIQNGAERIAPGAVLELDSDEAARLIEAGAVEPEENNPPRKADDPPPSPEGGGEATNSVEVSLADAIASLDRGDASLFTAGGKPTLAALRAAGAPAGVTAAERDAAWESAGSGAG